MFGLTASELLDAFNLLVLIYFALFNLAYLCPNLIAFWRLREQATRHEFLEAEELVSASGTFPVTVIAPNFNEEPTCVESTRSLLTLDYPAYEIIVVNDGSEDGTLRRMMDEFELVPASRAAMASLPTMPVRAIYRSRQHPHLWLIDKKNGGKSDALNVGLNYCRSPLFCAIDADSVLERDALTRIVRPFLEDERTLASGGVIRVVNGCELRSGVIRKVKLPDSWLASIQVVEYFRSFLSGRVGWATLGATLIISGAFGMFRRSTVIDAGGFWTGTVGEDMELVVRLHRHCREKKIPFRITFASDPVAWTEVPENLADLARQRDRWHRGLVQSLVRHLVILGNPRYGMVGLLGFPFFFLFEMLGPVIELAGYFCFVLALVLGRVSPLYAVTFLLLSIVFGVALSITAVAQAELILRRRYRRVRDLLCLFLLAFVEHLGYRQMNLLWRLRGIVSAIRRDKDWGRSKRRGFNIPEGGVVGQAARD